MTLIVGLVSSKPARLPIPSTILADRITKKGDLGRKQTRVVREAGLTGLLGEP